MEGMVWVEVELRWGVGLRVGCLIDKSEVEVASVWSKTADCGSRRIRTGSQLS